MRASITTAKGRTEPRVRFVIEPSEFAYLANGLNDPKLEVEGSARTGLVLRCREGKGLPIQRNTRGDTMVALIDSKRLQAPMEDLPPKPATTEQTRDDYGPCIRVTLPEWNIRDVKVSQAVPGEGPQPEHEEPEVDIPTPKVPVPEDYAEKVRALHGMPKREAPTSWNQQRDLRKQELEQQDDRREQARALNDMVSGSSPRRAQDARMKELAPAREEPKSDVAVNAEKLAEHWGAKLNGAPVHPHKPKITHRAEKGGETPSKKPSNLATLRQHEQDIAAPKREAIVEAVPKPQPTVPEGKRDKLDELGALIDLVNEVAGELGDDILLTVEDGRLTAKQRVTQYIDLFKKE